MNQLIRPIFGIFNLSAPADKNCLQTIYSQYWKHVMHIYGYKLTCMNVQNNLDAPEQETHNDAFYLHV